MLTIASGAEPTSFIGDVASSPHYASNRRPVTDDEKKNAMLLAQAALTADSFTVVMRPTHVYRRFYMVTEHFVSFFDNFESYYAFVQLLNINISLHRYLHY